MSSVYLPETQQGKKQKKSLYKTINGVVNDRTTIMWGEILTTDGGCWL